MHLTKELLEKVSKNIEETIRPILKEYSDSIGYHNDINRNTEYWNSRRKDIYKECVENLLVILDNEGLVP